MKVVPRRREEVGPFLEKSHPHTRLQGSVCVVHEGLREEGLHLGDEMGVYHRHPGQPMGKEYCLVCHRIDQEVILDRGDVSGGLPAEGEVDGFEASDQGSR